ncbi:unnamed protein product [Ectocarpus sp. 6 AP-2014]
MKTMAAGTMGIMPIVLLALSGTLASAGSAFSGSNAHNEARRRVCKPCLLKPPLYGETSNFLPTMKRSTSICAASRPKLRRVTAELSASSRAMYAAPQGADLAEVPGALPETVDPKPAVVEESGPPVAIALLREKLPA